MSVPLETGFLYDGVLVDGDIQDGPRLRGEADESVVAQAQTGDPAAFEELVRRFRNHVFGLAYHFVHNREEAWDISQDVFIKAHRSLNKFRGDANFKTWLMRITANQAKDCLKKKRVPTVEFNEAFQGESMRSRLPEPRRALEAAEIGEAIQQALETLSVKHRTAFVLREFEGLSYEEMARVMRCSIGTVMSRLHHARKKLQKSLLRTGLVEGM